jgi:hypothetical protein
MFHKDPESVIKRAVQLKVREEIVELTALGKVVQIER